MEELEIYSIRGELIKHEELNVFETVLDLDIKIKGTYLIKIKTGEGETIKKLIIN